MDTAPAEARGGVGALPERGATAAGHFKMLDALSELPPNAILTIDALAAIIGRDPRTVSRAVDRGELPPPVEWFDRQVWMAEAILNHLRDRLADRAREQRAAQRRARGG